MENFYVEIWEMVNLHHVRYAYQQIVYFGCGPAASEQDCTSCPEPGAGQVLLYSLETGKAVVYECAMLDLVICPMTQEVSQCLFR